MTNEEAIARIKNHKILHKMNEPRAIYISEALDMAIRALEQETCDDTVSRQAAIDAFERFIHELGMEDEPYNYGEMALSVKNVPPVTPKPKTGHWIPIVVRGQNSYCCSECLSECCYTPTAFCPECGCMMVEIEGT